MTTTVLLQTYAMNLIAFIASEPTLSKKDENRLMNEMRRTRAWISKQQVVLTVTEVDTVNKKAIVG